MSFLISAAHAAPAAAPAGASMMSQLPFMAAIFGIFYFLIIRPQSKRAKEHRSMIDSLAVDSEVIFAGGLLGKVIRLEGDYAVIALNRTTEVKVQKASVISVLPAGTLASL